MPISSQQEKSGSKNSRLRCQEIMTRSVTTANGAMNLIEVAALMKSGDMGALPVTDDENRLIGIVTDRDIVVRAVAENKNLESTTVSDVMTKDVFVARPDDFVFQAIRQMGDKQVRRIPIVNDNNALQGILSMADIALEMEDEREIAEALEDISSGAAFWGKK